jgi:hypothetical protein
MSLQVRLALEGNLEKFTKDVSAKLAYAAQYAIETYAKRLELALRDDTRSGALGDKVANAWQLKIYKDNPASPAALVYSKAPEIVTAFAGDTTITARGGHLYLAIPTDNVPQIGNKRMSPADVEARFSQKLIFLPGRPGTVLAFVSAVAAKSGHGFRPASKGRVSAARPAQLVLMFVMVQQVHLTKRLDWPRLMADAKDGFADFYDEALADALKD